jgi:S-adenosylmethionine synthetase
MIPLRVHTVVISTQHEDGISQEDIAKQLKEHVIAPVMAKHDSYVVQRRVYFALFFCRCVVVVLLLFCRCLGS